MITRKAARDIRAGIRFGRWYTRLGLEGLFYNAERAGFPYNRLVERTAFEVRNRREIRRQGYEG